MRHCHITVNGVPWCISVTSNMRLLMHHGLFITCHPRDPEEDLATLRKVLPDLDIQLVEGYCPTVTGAFDA